MTTNDESVTGLAEEGPSRRQLRQLLHDDGLPAILRGVRDIFQVEAQVTGDTYEVASLRGAAALVDLASDMLGGIKVRSPVVSAAQIAEQISEAADYGAKVAASNKLRSMVGLFPDGQLLSTEDITAACADIADKEKLIAEYNGYGDSASGRCQVTATAINDLHARLVTHKFAGARETMSANDVVRAAVDMLTNDSPVVDIGARVHPEGSEAHFAGIRFFNHKTRRYQNESQPGRTFVDFLVYGNVLFDVEACAALHDHADAGKVATLYGPSCTGIRGWARVVQWPTIDTIRDKDCDEVTFTFELHATEEEAKEASRHRFGFQRDEALPVAEIRRGTTIPDMGELKEWLADLLKLTWAARFPKLDRDSPADNADLANAFADEHRALCESLDKVFHDGTEEDDNAPESEETPPMEIGILAPLSDGERSVMTILSRMPHGPTDVSVYRSTSREETVACEKLVSLGYLVEENTHPTIGRNWSLTTKGHAFNKGKEPTDEDPRTGPWRTIEGVPVTDAERSILRTLVTAGLGASMVTHSAESPAVRAAGRRLRSLGYLASARQPYPAEVVLTDKGRHLALHTVEDGDALPFITREDGELSDAEVEQNAYAMIRGGTCVSAPHGTLTHTVGGARTNVALRMLASAGLIEQWEDAHGIFWASKTTRAHVAPPSLVASHEAVEPTTISTDPLLDAAADAMLEALRKGPIVNDPERPFSELTYQALGSLVEKGKAFDEMGSTGERTWHAIEPGEATSFDPRRDGNHHVGIDRKAFYSAPDTTKLDGIDIDGADSMTERLKIAIEEVNALVSARTGGRPFVWKVNAIGDVVDVRYTDSFGVQYGLRAKAHDGGARAALEGLLRNVSVRLWQRVEKIEQAHASPLAPSDPRNEVHALIAEHGGFGKRIPTGSTTFNRDGLLINGQPSPLNEVFKLTVALLELEAQAPTDLKGHGFMDMGDLSPNPSNASRGHAATCFAYAGLVYDLRHRLAVELSALAETARGNADRANRSSAYWTAELARMPIDKGTKLPVPTPPSA